MNEQELLMKKKQEKREKVDIILAYIMLVILLLAIAFVVYIKFFRKEEIAVEKPNDDVNYITIANIVNSLNSSELVSDYLADGATFNATTLSSGIAIKYVKDNDTLNFDIPQIGNELLVTINNQNKVVATDIYKEIGIIICTYYGNSRQACQKTIDNISGSSTTNGIRVEENADNKVVYLDITKKIDVSTTPLTYNEKTIVDMDDFNYSLVMNDVRIDDLELENLDNSLKISGKVYNLMSDSISLDIVFTVYDENDNELKNNKYSFADTNLLADSGDFEIAIEFDDTVNADSIKKYSIEIVK